MRSRHSQKLGISLLIPLWGMIFSDDSWTRFWRADVTGYDIFNRNIREGMKNGWDGVHAHYRNTTTFSNIGTVFPKEFLPCNDQFGNHKTRLPNLSEITNTSGDETAGLARSLYIFSCSVSALVYITFSIRVSRNVVLLVRETNKRFLAQGQYKNSMKESLERVASKLHHQSLSYTNSSSNIWPCVNQWMTIQEENYYNMTVPLRFWWNYHEFLWTKLVCYYAYKVHSGLCQHVRLA